MCFRDAPEVACACARTQARPRSGATPPTSPGASRANARAPIDVAPPIGRVDAASYPELVGRVRGLRALDAAFDVVRQAEERGRVAVGQRGDGRQRVVVRARPRDREAPHEVAAAVEDVLVEDLPQVRLEHPRVVGVVHAAAVDRVLHEPVDDVEVERRGAVARGGGRRACGGAGWGRAWVERGGGGRSGRTTARVSPAESTARGSLEAKASSEPPLRAGRRP